MEERRATASDHAGAAGASGAALGGRGGSSSLAVAGTAGEPLVNVGGEPNCELGEAFGDEPTEVPVGGDYAPPDNPCYSGSELGAPRRFWELGEQVSPWGTDLAFSNDELVVYYMVLNEYGSLSLWSASRLQRDQAFGTPEPVRQLSANTSSFSVMSSLLYTADTDGAIWVAGLPSPDFPAFDARLVVQEDPSGPGDLFVSSDFIVYTAAEEITKRWLLNVDAGSWQVFATAGDQHARQPVLTQDGRTMFFAWDGSSGFDIWRGYSGGGTAFDGYDTLDKLDKLSSEEDEYPSWWSDKQCHLYLTRGADGARSFLVSEALATCGGKWVELDRDPEHCGSCERACGEAACVDRRCEATTVAAGGNLPGSLFVRNGEAYWANLDSVNKVDLQSGQLTPLISNAPGISSVTADFRNVYFGLDASLWSTPRDIAGPTLFLDPALKQLARGTDMPAQRTELTSDGSYLYWVDCTSVPRVTRVQKDGCGEPLLLMAGAAANCNSGIALDTERLYWATENGLFSVPKAGGAALTLVKDGVVPSDPVYFQPDRPLLALAVDASYAYWVNERNVMRVAKGGGSVETLVANRPGPLRGIALDEQFAYFASGTGQIMKVLKSGGTATELVAGETAPLVAAVDSTHVYWVEETNGGRIRRVVK